MAIDLTLRDTLLPHDESNEEAFERALTAWQTVRARFETVDVARLTPASREAYFRAMVRIGLWSDARVVGDDVAIASDESSEE